jgi:hypothetical protein
VPDEYDVHGAKTYYIRNKSLLRMLYEFVIDTPLSALRYWKVLHRLL